MWRWPSLETKRRVDGSKQARWFPPPPSLCQLHGLGRQLLSQESVGIPLLRGPFQLSHSVLLKFSRNLIISPWASRTPRPRALLPRVGSQCELLGGTTVIRRQKEWTGCSLKGDLNRCKAQAGNQGRFSFLRKLPLRQLQPSLWHFSISSAS